LLSSDHPWHDAVG
jgi:DNA-binding NarL/FixJ family response regulator/gas vesicle protein